MKKKKTTKNDEDKGTVAWREKKHDKEAATFFLRLRCIWLIYDNQVIEKTIKLKNSLIHNKVI